MDDDEGLDGEQMDGSGAEGCDADVSEVSEGFTVSRMPWVMVLASEGEMVFNDSDKYWGSVMSDGADMSMWQCLSFGLEAPSVPVVSLGTIEARTLAVGADGDDELERESTDLILLNRILPLVDDGFRVSCRERVSPSGSREAGTRSLRKGRPLFLRPDVEMWLPMGVEGLVKGL